MYKISVPLTLRCLENYGFERMLEKVRLLDAERVFLCPTTDNIFNGRLDEEAALLKKYTPLFQAEGYETGCWIWALMFRGESKFMPIISPKGQGCADEVCPTDRDFREFMGNVTAKFAGCGIDILMFDDDFRFGYRENGFGCCCDNHRKMISEILGEEVSLPTLEKHILHGGKNKYRNAFLEANGRSLEEFALCMRKSVDKVNPRMRMGFCSCINSWDIDGTHPDKISKILAGNTAPFYRLIGAPYWAALLAWGNRLADVIELERIEAQRRRDSKIEIFSEGDTYPRPRYKVPASYLEGFDTALRAAGCTDGILKYALDYTASPDYEDGYVKAHVKNKALYKEIDLAFSDKESTGIRVWDKAEKLGDMNIPKVMEGNTDIESQAFSVPSRFLNACSMPSVHEGNGVFGVAFGEDVKVVPDDALSSGMILDLPACLILKEKGIDTGIISVGEILNASAEAFPTKGERVGLSCRFSAVTLKESAVIDSFFVSGNKEYPAVFRYENNLGQKFTVICAEMYFNDEQIYRQYTRAAQIRDAAGWFGKDIPAVCAGHPDLYIQSKENDRAVAVGLWNFFADEIAEPIVELSIPVKSVRGINCQAKADGNKVYLSPIPAYGFAGFEAERS